MVLTSYRRSEA